MSVKQSAEGVGTRKLLLWDGWYIIDGLVSCQFIDD